MVDHYFVPYPESPNKRESCLRCGRLPVDHPTAEKDFQTLADAAIVPFMDYTDSIANATGALRSSLSQVVEACIDLPGDMPDWRESDQWYDLCRVLKALDTLTEDDRDTLPTPSLAVTEMNIHRARMAKWG